MDFLYNWLTTKSLLVSPNPHSYDADTNQVWKSPPPSFFKCNVDAVIFADIQSMGVGIVLRDDIRLFIVGRSYTQSGICHAQESEAFGLYEALAWIRGLQLQNVIFEVDSLVVLHRIQSKEADLSEFRMIIRGCRLFLELENSFSVCHVRRQANEATHVLAR